MTLKLAGCVILNSENKILLLGKKKHMHYEIPGGKIENNETDRNCAIRETKEEIGADVDIIDDIGVIYFDVDNIPCSTHSYLSKIKNDFKPKICEPDKFFDIKWVDINNINGIKLAPNVKILFAKIKSKEINLFS